MAESRAKRVRIKEMDGWTLGLLVDYIYTAEIQVTEENVQVSTHTRNDTPTHTGFLPTSLKLLNFLSCIHFIFMTTFFKIKVIFLKL